ncbi:hypothetical protein D1007_54101 [Hordeum vulgare]|nr:hypothetical protein D1007_54101 [Hordeum vulgare]
MAEEDDEAQHGDLIDLNLLAEEEDEAQHGDLIDLNLLTEEEDEAQHGDPIDLNLMDEDEQDQQDVAKEEAQVADEEEAQVVQEEEAQHVQRIWTNAKRQLDSGQEVDVSNKKKGDSGRKRKQLDLSRTATIPLNRRRPIRSLAKWVGVPRSMLHDRFQLKELNHITNTIKPSLKPANKIARLEFCISMMDKKWISTPWPSFKSMNNMVHIDEKCIGKVMFLTAVAKPRYSDEGEMTFDGKIGTWAFVVETEEQRTSQNRYRGTMELKSLKVTRPVCRDYLINKVIPAIEDKWPDDDDGTTIFIQQDNGRPHVPPNDPEFREAVEQTDLDIHHPDGHEAVGAGVPRHEPHDSDLLTGVSFASCGCNPPCTPASASPPHRRKLQTRRALDFSTGKVKKEEEEKKKKEEKKEEEKEKKKKEEEKKKKKEKEKEKKRERG